MMMSTSGKYEGLDKKEVRKMKNRESAERNRQERNNKIETLSKSICQMSVELYGLQVENWSLRRQFSRLHEISDEPYPEYVPPVLEPAVF